jgi:hypothetical protein
LAKEVTLPFEYHNKLIFLKVKVNKTDSLLFLMDTGANTSAIDEKISDRISLKETKTTTVEGTAGTIQVHNVQTERLVVGSMSVKGLIITKQDLSGSPAPPGRQLEGILGTDFLKQFTVTINFPNKTIHLSDRRTNAAPGGIPLIMNNGIPSVQVTLNDSISTYLRYDSGASLFDTDDIYLNIPLQVFHDLHIDSSKVIFHLSANGIGGEIKLPVYKARSVTFGTAIIKNPYLIVQPVAGYFARTDALGFFSNNLLERYNTVTIDFLSDKIFLPGQKETH